MIVRSGKAVLAVIGASVAVVLAAVVGTAQAQAQVQAQVEVADAPTAAQIASVPVVPIRPSKLILVGDSTMQMGSGWGGRLCSRRVASTVACLNLARGGRSTSSYRREGSWDLALAEMSTPGYVATYVLIQFGHNDQHRSAERYADPDVMFPQNLRLYVQEARERGAVPVLVTPLTRRQFRNGVLENDLAPWAEATRRVARELNVPLLDLYADSAAAVQAMGPFLAAQFAPVSPSGEAADALVTGDTLRSAPVPTPARAATLLPAPAPAPAPAPEPRRPAFATGRQAFDYTHLGESGAEFFSAMVTRQLAQAVPELQRVLYP